MKVTAFDFSANRPFRIWPHVNFTNSVAVQTFAATQNLHSVFGSSEALMFRNSGEWQNLTSLEFINVTTWIKLWVTKWFIVSYTPV